MLYNKNILVLGLDSKTLAVTKLLTPDNKVTLVYAKTFHDITLNELKMDNAAIVKASIVDDYVDYISSSYDVLIVSSGVRDKTKLKEKARMIGKPILNELEVSFHYLPNAVNIISVCGGTGRAITASLIYEMLKNDGYNVELVLEENDSLASIISSVKSNDYVVINVSEEELDNIIEYKSNMVVMTNLYNLDKDIMKKALINLNEYDTVIVNKEDAELLSLINNINSSIKYFSLKNISDAYYLDGSLYYEKEKIIDLRQIVLKGLSNYENVLASVCACKELGVSNEVITKVLSTYKGVKHSLEYIASLYNVNFYDDSKSSNIKDTINAITALPGKILLIMGDGKESDLEELKSYLKNVLFIAAIGEDRYLIKDFSDRNHIACEVHEKLEASVLACYAKAQAGDNILLSPAYKSEELLGDEFTQIINNLENEG